MTTKQLESKDTVHFFNIPRDWMCMIGFEYTKINKAGETKLTKYQKPVIGKIDHVDLFLLDEIRGFKERGNAECFKEARALAEDLGMPGKETEMVDRVLQLYGLGLVDLKQQGIGRGIPRLILEVNPEVLKEFILFRKESILLEQRMDSQQVNFSRLVRKNHLLQESLYRVITENNNKESSQEQGQKPLAEDEPELLKETYTESTQAGPRAATRTRPECFDIFNFEDQAGGQDQLTESSASISYTNNKAADGSVDVYGEQVYEMEPEHETGPETEPGRFDWLIYAIENDVQYGYISHQTAMEMRQTLMATYNYTEEDIDEIIQTVTGRQEVLNRYTNGWPLQRISKAFRLLLDELEKPDNGLPF